MILVEGSKCRSQTCCSSIARDTMRPWLRTRYSRSWNSRGNRKISLPRRLAVRDTRSIARSPTRRMVSLTMVSLRRPSASTRADDQNRRGDAVVAQLTHHRNAVDVREHAVDRDHGIVACRAPVQRLVAAGGQIHLVTAGGELFHELISGLGVVLDDQNTAAA